MKTKRPKSEVFFDLGGGFRRKVAHWRQNGWVGSSLYAVLIEGWRLCDAHVETERSRLFWPEWGVMGVEYGANHFGLSPWLCLLATVSKLPLCCIMNEHTRILHIGETGVNCNSFYILWSAANTVAAINLFLLFSLTMMFCLSNAIATFQKNSFLLVEKFGQTSHCNCYNSPQIRGKK